MFYSVEVVDRQTRMEVTVGQMLSKSEALRLANVIKM